MVSQEVMVNQPCQRPLTGRGLGSSVAFIYFLSHILYYREDHCLCRVSWANARLAGIKEIGGIYKVAKMASYMCLE